MCGRYGFEASSDQLHEAFPSLGELELVGPWPEPRYNICPGTPAPVILREGRRAQLTPLVFGLLPHWAKGAEHRPRPLNARAEGIARHRLFGSLFRARRAVVPASLFYEWRVEREGRGAREPFCVRPKDGKPLALAAIWDEWRAAGAPVRSFAILTIESRGLLQTLHPRQPLILPSEAIDAWLDPANTDPIAMRKRIRPYPTQALDIYRVSERVNRAGAEGRELSVQHFA